MKENVKHREKMTFPHLHLPEAITRYSLANAFNISFAFVNKLPSYKGSWTILQTIQQVNTLPN